MRPLTGAVLALFALMALMASIANASLVGQTEPDENGRVLCFYEDFNTGETYIKSELYACPSR